MPISPQDQLYHQLLLLTDLPGHTAAGLRAAAGRLLQQLPTCTWARALVTQALTCPAPEAALRSQLLGQSLVQGQGSNVAAGGSGAAAGDGVRPGRLLYLLQVRWCLEHCLFVRQGLCHSLGHKQQGPAELV